MTARRFGVLLRGLPPSALVWRDDNGGWSASDHLIADLIEAVYAVRGAVIAQMTTKPGTRIKFPDPVKVNRPGAKPKKRTWGDLARRLRG